MAVIGHPHRPDNECKEALELDLTPDPGETAGQLWTRREAMQAEAASLLGQMLFAFSYIDVNLGLCLAWVDNGTRLETLSKSVAEQNIHTKLEALLKHVAEKFPAGSKRRVAYECWIERVHVARVQRNQMVHGRWGIEAHRHKVVNVVGLPSGTQQCIEYTLEELTAFNEELLALERELARLRKHWPI
ncbi:MAG: hypothetical protein EOP21_09555 [Hyphomicrobiales bacterium]|nr:MAG: hypothetical protein EOP21_09555 [Hyphomicrobiales bacterium]